MANRFWTDNSQRKITAPSPPKDSRGGSSPPYPEKTHGWLKNIGPVGPKRNTTRVKEVKAYATQHMADDKYLPDSSQNPAVPPPELFRAPNVQVAPPPPAGTGPVPPGLNQISAAIPPALKPIDMVSRLLPMLRRRGRIR